MLNVEEFRSRYAAMNDTVPEGFVPLLMPALGVPYHMKSNTKSLQADMLLCPFFRFPSTFPVTDFLANCENKLFFSFVVYCDF